MFYLNTAPIRAKTVQKLCPRREVYRFTLDTCHELHGLPTVVIVKRIKDGWHDEFEEEKRNYERLKSLQGSVVPTFFGEGTFNDSPIIIISEVVGKTLHELAHSMATISSDELRGPLEKALEQIHSLGAEYLDQKLDNFILCNTGEIMIVDLEQVDYPPDLKNFSFRESVNYGGVGCLLYLLDDIRQRKSQMARDNFLPGGPYALTGSLY